MSEVSCLNSLIIYAHPNPASFNGALLDKSIELLEAYGEVKVHDLYSMNFQPVLGSDDFAYFHQKTVAPDVRPLQEDIEWAEYCVVIFPTWWAGMPAILKGYFDRVLTTGFAYSYDAQGNKSVPLKGRKVAIFQTAGTPANWLGRQLQAFETVANEGIFGFIGWEVVTHKLFDGVPGSTSAQRHNWLTEVADVIESSVGVRH
jgi:NAD(P)H dehydrogenase (quinone)